MAKKPAAIATKQTKSQILSTLAEDTGLTKKEIAAVYSKLWVNMVESWDWK